MSGPDRETERDWWRPDPDGDEPRERARAPEAPAVDVPRSLPPAWTERHDPPPRSSRPAEPPPRPRAPGPRPEPSGRTPFALVAGLVVALLGALVWGLAARWTGRELGIVAWAIGFGVGFTVLLAAGRRSAALQGVAVVPRKCGSSACPPATSVRSR